jgi:hypothetical protein
MIIQITLTKNECFLIKEMLPVWSRFVDGFIFLSDGSTDDTVEFLTNNKEKYNILHVIDKPDNLTKKLKNESEYRQELYDTALKYTNKIICLDTDEYLEGSMTKESLERALDTNPNTVFYLQWVQYASKNTLRVDGMWAQNFTDRIGCYPVRKEYAYAQSHCLHMPPTGQHQIIPPNMLYIAHLQWLDKRWVGVKQYYWKVMDYVNKTVHGEGFHVVGKEAYDNSVSNFAWNYAAAPYELRIPDDIFKRQDITKNDRLHFIKKYTKEYNIPNLGDWGMGIYDYCLKD